MKKKMESAKKIWRFYKKSKQRTIIIKNLKIIVSRIRVWKKIALRYEAQVKKRVMTKVMEWAKEKREEEKKSMQKKLM